VNNCAKFSQKTFYRSIGTSSYVLSASKELATATSADPTNMPAGIRRYPHDAPERDFVNFPPFRVKDEGDRTRMCIVPEKWMQAMYDKTGVTGPYILFWGAVATIFSKEFFILSIDTGSTLSFILAVALISKYGSPKLLEFLEKEGVVAQKEQDQEKANKFKALHSQIAKMENLESLPVANTLVHEAKKENVSLQLESEYRERMLQVYNDVKKRLDYQISLQNAYHRLEREQAINYITSEVSKSIGAVQEKDAFQLGLNQLKALSQKYAGTI